MSVTGQTIRAALAVVKAVGNQNQSFDALAEGADDALRKAPAGLTSAGAAAFLATCAVESAWFRTTQEYGKGQRYAPYIGRTYIQLTWAENYRAFGAWCWRKGLVTDPNCFVNDPTSLANRQWAWLGATFYFETHNLWVWANSGEFRKVSQAVNGGDAKAGTSFTPNGWTERSKMYDVFRAAGNGLLPDGVRAPAVSESGRPTLHEGDTSELVWAVQCFMNRNFPAYSNISAGIRPPSRLGPQTVAALTEFQRRSGIPTDPPFAFGPKSWAALEAAGFRG